MYDAFKSIERVFRLGRVPSPHVPVDVWNHEDAPNYVSAFVNLNGHRPAAVDIEGRHWLLDGSGECA